jgi:cell division protein FtsB
MSKLTTAVKVFRNKYVVAIAAFALWILFFDRNDVFTQWDRKTELEKLETSKAYYEAEIVLLKKELSDLQNNPAILEKFARENFYLKRPSEDVFIVEDSIEVKK